MCDTYSITISPETSTDLDTWLSRIPDIKGVYKFVIVREFGEEGTHEHFHATLHFDTQITLQTLFPRLKKVFGFIPKKPLVKVKPIRTLVDLENWTNYLYSEEGSIEEEVYGYLPGEIDALVLQGKANDVLNKSSSHLSYRFLEKVIDWTKIKDRTELLDKLYELKRKGYDCTNIVTNPRKLACWYYFMKNAHNPKTNEYADFTYKYFHPD